jgi:hypothetical protein
MVETFSEPSGTFRSDNFLSNEAGYQDVIPKLRTKIKPGGVYLGVGPEQNFTYVHAFDSKLAFIVDIRRLNMLEHLLYKALFELSADRSEFVSRLFSRPPPSEISAKSSAAALFKIYDRVPANKKLFEKNLGAVLEHLTSVHGFRLSEDDEANIRYAYNAFFQSGPQLSYTFIGSYYQGRLSNMPSYQELMMETDSSGHNWSFLNSEGHFRKVQSLHKKNLIVPIVGDFAGPKAIRAIAQYLKSHNATVSIFYTSNVEMYLFQQDHEWKVFYDNVAELPINPASSFIRFVVNRSTFGFGRGRFGLRSQSWSLIDDVIYGVQDGAVTEYSDVVRLSE